MNYMVLFLKSWRKMLLLVFTAKWGPHIMSPKRWRLLPPSINKQQLPQQGCHYALSLLPSDSCPQTSSSATDLAACPQSTVTCSRQTLPSPSSVPDLQCAAFLYHLQLYLWSLTSKLWTVMGDICRRSLLTSSVPLLSIHLSCAWIFW